MARPRSDIKDRLVAVALPEFLKKGVDGASLRTIARAAGTSIGMVYYYFPTKDELFLGVVESVYESLLERLEQALSPSAFPEQVRRLYEFFSSFDDRERTVARVLVREILSSADRLERLLERFRQGHIPLFAKMVSRGFAEGHLSPAHHPLVVVACLIGIGVLPQVAVPLLAQRVSLGKGGELRLERLPEELAAIFLRGLAGPQNSGGNHASSA